MASWTAFATLAPAASCEGMRGKGVRGRGFYKWVAPYLSALRSLLRERPFVGLLFGLRSGHSIPLLNSPDQLILLAGDSFPVIVGEFSPAVAGRAGEPLPLAFDLVPIHVLSFTFRFSGVTHTGARLPPYEFEKFMRRRWREPAHPVSSRGEMCIPEGRFCTYGRYRAVYLRVAAVWEAWPDSCTDTNQDTSIRRNTTWQRIHQSLVSMRIAQRFRMSSTSCIKPGTGRPTSRSYRLKTKAQRISRTRSTPRRRPERG